MEDAQAQVSPRMQFCEWNAVGCRPRGTIKASSGCRRRTLRVKVMLCWFQGMKLWLPHFDATCIPHSPHHHQKQSCQAVHCSCQCHRCCSHVRLALPIIGVCQAHHSILAGRAASASFAWRAMRSHTHRSSCSQMWRTAFQWGCTTTCGCETRKGNHALTFTSHIRCVRQPWTHARRGGCSHFLVARELHGLALPPQHVTSCQQHDVLALQTSVAYLQGCVASLQLAFVVMRIDPTQHLLSRCARVAAGHACHCRSSLWMGGPRPGTSRRLKNGA